MGLKFRLGLERPLQCQQNTLFGNTCVKRRIWRPSRHPTDIFLLRLYNEITIYTEWKQDGQTSGVEEEQVKRTQSCTTGRIRWNWGGTCQYLKPWIGRSWRAVVLSGSFILPRSWMCALCICVSMWMFDRVHVCLHSINSYFSTFVYMFRIAYLLCITRWPDHKYLRVIHDASLQHVWPVSRLIEYKLLSCKERSYFFWLLFCLYCSVRNLKSASQWLE